MGAEKQQNSLLSNSLADADNKLGLSGSHKLPSLLVLDQMKDSLRNLIIEAPALLMRAESLACSCDQGRTTTSQCSTLSFFLCVGGPRELWASKRRLWISVISAWSTGTKPESARCRQPQQNRVNNNGPSPLSVPNMGYSSPWDRAQPGSGSATLLEDKV